MIQRTWWPRLNPNAQLAKGLVFAGLGGGASTLQYADASGYGNHGTLTNMDGSNWLFDPILGRFVLNFTATGQYVVAPSILLGSSDFTVAGWVQHRAGSATYPVLVSEGDTGSGEWMLLLTSANTCQFYGSTGSVSVLGGSYSSGKWVHVACHRSGKEARLFVNGIHVASDTYASANLSTTKSLQLGGADSDSDRWLVGLLGDILVYNRALSPAEISQLADPSNTLLSGLILPPRRMVFPAAVAGGAYSLDCDSIAFTLSSMAPDLLVGRVLDAAAGEFTLAGQDAGLEQGYALSCDAGSFTLTGQDATLTATRTLSCDSGEFTFTGQDASLESGATLAAEAGSFTLTGQAANLEVGRMLDAGSGEFTLIGQEVTLTYAPAGAYSITADAGTFTLTGEAASLTATRTLSCDAGSFTLIGQDATLQHGYSLGCDAGSFTLTGQDTSFQRALALACNAGAFTLTGQAVTLTYSAAIGSIYGTWTPPARSRTWTPAARSRTWTPQSRGN